jgi:hypothetical protein
MTGCGIVSAASVRSAPATSVTRAGGCPGGQPTGPIDLRVLRQVDYDYQPYAKPGELAATKKAAEVVVAGRVEGFLPGMVYHDRRDHRVLMRVRVEDRFKGRSAQFVYVELYQGGVSAATNEPIQTIGDFKRAVPSGTRALLFLTKITARKDGKDRSGLPRDTAVYAPHPQGILLQEVIGSHSRMLSALVDLWPGWKAQCGIDGLATRLRTHGFTG